MNENLSRRRFVGAAAAGAAALSAAGWAAEQPSETPAAGPRTRSILDAHVHLKHGNAERTEYSAQVIVQTMDAVGISQAIVFAMSTTTKRSMEMAEAAVSQYPQRLIPYVYALPHYERPVIHEIEAALKGRRFRGVKIHVGECTLADYVIDPVLKLAGKYGALCLVDLGGRLDVAQRLAQAFPDTRLVIAHMGRYLAKDAALVDQFIRLAEQHRNVVLDTSGVALADKIVEAAKRIGSARLVWGTDGPHADPDTVTFARNELNKILKLDLAEADKANILGGSVRALLGLS